MSDRKPSRWLYTLTAGVLLLGTLMVVAGTRTTDDRSAKEHRQDGCGDEGHRMRPGTSVPIERDAGLQQGQCAGCHAREGRQVGPSDGMMAARYRSRPEA